MATAHTPDSPPPITAEALLTVPEVMQLLRISRAFLYTETREGHLPAIRLGRAVRYRRSDVEHYLTQRTQDGHP